MDADEVLRKIDNSREDMIEIMCDMIRIPAISPISGGDGESKRADMLIKLFENYDSVERIDVPDITNPSILRSNILAKKNGKGKGTLWLVAHIDTVPSGDIEDWDTPPFEPVVKDGKIYGRGTEDNGQALLSTLFASKFIPKEILSRKSIGVAFVADEENSSRMGIEHLINEGFFSKDDVFIVPDWGTPEGDVIDVAEKNLIWLKFIITGKSTHGSTPDKGINAFKVGTQFLGEVLEKFEKEFSSVNDLFSPPRSTFEPTQCTNTVLNVNTIPGHYEFYMDIRLLPEHSMDRAVEIAQNISDKYRASSGALIKIEEVQRHISGKPSSTDSETFIALSEAIKEVTGVNPKPIGVGGATCANFFRTEGCDAYVWESGGGTLHGANEYVLIENMIKDAKVFALVLFKLCI